MRLFIAIKPPQNILTSLQNLQIIAKKQVPKHVITDEVRATDDHFKTPHSPWRFSDSHKIHLTLQFLGDSVTQHKVDDIKQKLSQIQFEKFEMECADVGGFPKASAARVLWAGIKSQKLIELAHKVHAAMEEIGFGEDKTFSPHITIARCKYLSDATQFVQKNKDRIWNEQRWGVSEFSLVESVSVLGGYEYETLQKYSLL